MKIVNLRLSVFFVAMLLLLYVPAQLRAQEKPPLIPVEKFFKNPDKFSWRISPDGQYISYLAPHMGHTNVFVRKMAEAAAIAVTHDTTRNIYQYRWKSNRIIYLQDIGGDENFQLFSVSLDGKEKKALTAFPKVRTTILNDLRYVPGKEKEIMIGLNKRDARFFDPYSINIETGEMTLLYQNDKNFDSWYTDHAGIIRIASKTDGVNTTYYHRASVSAPFDSLFTTSYKETFVPQFFHL